MRRSAGLLLYRLRNEVLELFLVHPGGPFWKNKDEGAWSVPKGEFGNGEDPLAAALREFKEETGFAIDGNFIELIPVKQKGGKLVLVWAVEHNIDPGKIRSNTFTIDWPPRSGKQIEVPEIDKADWFTMEEASQKINPGQLPLLHELVDKLKSH